MIGTGWYTARVIGALLAAVLVALPPALAAGKAQKPRTLEEVVAFALEHGKDQVMEAGTAEKLGLAAMSHASRRTRYKQSASPDRKEHSFGVIYEKDEEGRLKPLHLILTVGSAKKDGDRTLVDILSYRTDLKSKLKACIRTSGPLGDVEQSSLPVDGAAQKGLRSELEFHRRVAPSLGLVPAE